MVTTYGLFIDGKVTGVIENFKFRYSIPTLSKADDIIETELISSDLSRLRSARPGRVAMYAYG